MGKKRTTYKKQDVPFFIKKLLAILDVRLLRFRMYEAMEFWSGMKQKMDL